VSRVSPRLLTLTAFNVSCLSRMEIAVSSDTDACDMYGDGDVKNEAAM
jgi:hypothetical protein